MAGIGVKLNQIYEKNTITTNLVGFGYSAMVTIAPMFFMIGVILLMSKVLGYSKLPYASRELFSCTVLYQFVFSLLTTAPFNAVLSRYMADVIYDENYDAILPCFEVGLLLNLLFSCMAGIPFCIYEFLQGQVGAIYVFTGYCGYISLVLVFYTMLYLSVCKDYKKISLFFFIGMAGAFLLSVLFVFVFGMDTAYSMLLALALGFLIIAVLELTLVKRHFQKSNGEYKEVLRYFVRYWKLAVTNFLYILGLYIHNFVFWRTDLRMEVADSFVCAPPYDMAGFLAVLTNITASIIFITRVEMNFHGKYKAYSEAVIGGRGADIKIAKDRMFGQLSIELMNLARIQFIISVVMFLICIVVLPQFGFAGLVMQIYPCLAAGYFILFLMYGAIIFLHYFNDLSGGLCTAFGFCMVTLLGSIFSSRLSPIWYGFGVVLGAFTGWAIAYTRLRWVERNMDIHIFCQGRILKKGRGKKPLGKVYDLYEGGEKKCQQ